MTRTDSLGEIIDKLIVNNIKQFMQEEIRHNGNSEERLKASDNIAKLNRRRWVLIGAINEILDPSQQQEFKDYGDNKDKK